MARIKDMYKAEVAPALMKKFEYKSPMQIPKLDKIVINCGVGEVRRTPRHLTQFLRTSSSSQVRRQFLPSQRSRSLTSRSVRA